MRNFIYCPSCRAESLEWPGENHFVCQNCGYTLFFNTAGAVGVIMYRKDELVLLRRNREPAMGLLDLPGGFIDYDESAQTASKREVFEETGYLLEQKNLEFVTSAPNRYLYKDVLYHTCDIFFKVEVREFPSRFDPAEVADLVIVGKDSIDYNLIAFESVKTALRCFCGD